MLSADQHAAYVRDGFLILRGHVPAAQCLQLASWADDLLTERDRSGYVRKYNDEDALARGEQVLSRIEHLRPFHSGMAALLDSEALRGLAGELLGEKAVLFKDKLNYKLPGSSGFALHQDMQAGWGRYAPELVTLMVSIDATTIHNGCLELLSGAHRRGLIGQEWVPLSAADIHAPLLSTCTTLPGDVIAFTAHTPHRSAKNRTSMPRRALFATYNAHAHGDHYAQYFADKLEGYPPDIERKTGREYRYRV